MALTSPATVAEFLSDGWFDALAAALSGLRPATSALGAPAPGLALGQIVTGVPDDAGVSGLKNGEVRYTIVLGQDSPASLLRDSVESAEVTIVTDWSTAQAIASGSSSVSDMLSAGKLKLRGDTSALVAAGDLLAMVAPLIAGALA
jgi:hypothetical protein